MNLLRSESELLACVKGCSDIIICGSGAVGKKTCKALLGNGVKVARFAVSESKTIPEPVFGIDVCRIEQLGQLAETALFLVAVSSKLHAELRAALEGIRAKNVHYISDGLYLDLKANYKELREALKFQIHVTEHCNLNCRGCYHFSTLAEEEYLDLDQYCSDLKRLAELFGGEMEEILLLGGEPLLHPQMADIISQTRMFFSKGTIKILSNGILLQSMPEAFWDACVNTGTEIWLTKYPIPLDFQKIEETAQNHGLQIQYFSHEPVRTLGHQPLDLEGGHDYVKNFTSCYRANECIALDHGKLYSCIIPAYIRHFNKYFNRDLKVTERDCVDIYEASSKEEILEKLLKPVPFCKYCQREDFAVFGTIPWEQSKYKIEEWTL